MIRCQDVVSQHHGATGKPILNGLNCEINSGDFVAIVGANGAGKSSLLKAISGLLPLRSGEIRVNNIPVVPHCVKQVRRQLAMLCQGGKLVPQLSALDNVLCGSLGNYSALETLWGFPRTSKEKARELLTKLNLQQQIHQITNQLSGGQQQRVAIARALMQSPQILLADEPTSGLDIYGIKQVMDTLSQLHQEGMTIITVLHDPNLVREYANKVIVIEQGKVIESNLPQVSVNF